MLTLGIARLECSLSRVKPRHFSKPRKPHFSTRPASKHRYYCSSTFDYNQEYFLGTKLRLEIDEESGNRSIFATEDLPPNEILLITPYYNHVVHHDALPHFCSTCHDSLDLLGLKETAIRSKFIKTHRYCSDACRDRGEPIYEVMSKPLRAIQKSDPDFYVSFNDKIRVVLYTLARKWLDQSAKPAPLQATPVEEESFERLGRPKVVKETSLTFADFERLCQLDIRSSNQLLSPKIQEAFLTVNDRMIFLLHDSPLMKLGTTPLDVLCRNAANSFSVDKYDNLDPARAAKFGLSEPSGEATFPLASYFNHNCMPNCSFALDMNANLVVSTSQTVDADDELTISYDANGIKSPTKEKQSERNMRQRCKKLCRDTWTFECNCIIP